MRLKLKADIIKNFSLMKSIAGTDPIHKNILIMARKNGLTKFAVSDGKISYTFITEAEIDNLPEDLEGDGVCIDAVQFCDLLLGWNKDFILDCDKEKATVKLGKSKYIINGMAWQNFPNLPKAKQEDLGMIIEKKVLENVLYYNYCYQKKTDNLSAFLGIKFIANDIKVTSYASDGLVFGYYESPREELPEFYSDQKPIECSIPGIYLSDIKKFLTIDLSTFTIKEENGTVFIFSDSNRTLAFTGIALPFPDITKVVKMNTIGYQFKVNTNSFLEILRRLIKTTDQKSGQINLNFTGNVLTLSAKNSLTTGEEELEVENTHEQDIEFSANGFSLMDFTEHITTETFLFTINDLKNRLQICDDHIRYVTVPMITNTIEVKKNAE